MKNSLIGLLAVTLIGFFVIKAQIPIGGGGNGGGGQSSTTVAAPYITISGTKYVAETMWPFTAFPTCSSLDAQTATLTAGTNGSEAISYSSAGSTNFWCSAAATTSVEAEFKGGCGTNSLTITCIIGIWICDTTNSKLYDIELINNPTSGQASAPIEFSSWTLTSCAGTPGTQVVIGNFPRTTKGTMHFKLVKVSTNLQALVSDDAGQTYYQVGASQAVGTLSKGGVTLRAGVGATVTNATFLSTVIN